MPERIPTRKDTTDVLKGSTSPELLLFSPDTEVRVHHIVPVLPELVGILNWRQSGTPPTDDEIFDYVLDQIQEFTIGAAENQNTQSYLGLVLKDIYGGTEQYITGQTEFLSKLVNLSDDAPVRMVVGPDSMCEACALRKLDNTKELLSHCSSSAVSEGEVVFMSNFEQYLKKTGYREGVDYVSRNDDKNHPSLKFSNITFIESLTQYKTYLESEEEKAS